MPTFKPDQFEINSRLIRIMHVTRQTGITKRAFKGIHGVEKAAEEFICRNSKQMPLLTYSGDHRHIYTVATESAC